ncbi:MAG TPA: alpha/beta family hydrolase [Acidimicrobiia bacterium]|nr:alpha/beta family hydrolase [Acidimicrobiia bacterium]
METLRIPVGDGAVTGRLTGTGPDGILLAHGAGTDQDHPFMALLRDALAAVGLRVLTFNYPYTERGSRRPDSTDRLLDSHRAAASTLAGHVERVYLAGRSMGGRMGLYLAAEGWPAAGVVLYAYPLHPAGRPETLRVDRFPDVGVPMLFFQGTRDPLARMDLFDRYIRPLPNATVEILEGASHSTRGGGWTDQSTAEHLATRTAEWVRGAARMA